MDELSLENTFTCQPQQRNMHGRIFGGFLMRWACMLVPAALPGRVAHLRGTRAAARQARGCGERLGLPMAAACAWRATLRVPACCQSPSCLQARL